MKDKTQICVRCKGRKKVYTCGGGYVLSNIGGKEVDCPLCLGKGINIRSENKTNGKAKKNKKG